MPINIPNVLTIFRIFLVPVFLHFLLEDRFLLAIAVFATAGITDAIDGYIARAFRMRTEFGAVIDPIADKLLVDVAYAALAVKGMAPLWLSAPVIARDVILVSGVLVLKGAGRKVAIRPTVYGKLTTFLQITTVICAMALADEMGRLFTALSIATATATVYSGVDYTLREMRIQRGRGGGR